MLQIIFLFLSVIFLTISYFMTQEHHYWRKRNVPHVKAVLWKFMAGSQSLSEIYKDIYDTHPSEANVGLFLGSRPAIMVRDLKNIRAVFQSDFHSFSGRGVLRNTNDLLADNVLLMEEYERWRLVRQKISPVFTSRKLKHMFYILERCARDFVQLIENEEQIICKPFNVLYTYTTASIGASVFGIATNTKNTMDSPFLEMAWKALQPSFINNLKFCLCNIFPLLVHLLQFKTFGDHEEFFIGVVKRVLKIRRMKPEKRHDFIDMCIELQEGGLMEDSVTGYKLEPTDELMAAQAFFFFLAGADTSAYTMHFILLELSGNPNILQNVHKEIDNTFDKCKERITFDEIENMKYLDMVMNEANRKYPSVGVIQRRCTKDTTLPVGNVKIEKDVFVEIPVYALHRDKNYFPNPDLFDPERFSPENISNIPKFSYLPFGEGNRMCIGARLARLQVKVGLAWLLRRYTLKHQVYNPKHFEPSFFSLRDPNARFDLIPRKETQ